MLAVRVLSLPAAGLLSMVGPGNRGLCNGSIPGAAFEAVNTSLTTGRWQWGEFEFWQWRKINDSLPPSTISYPCMPLHS